MHANKHVGDLVTLRRAADNTWVCRCKCGNEVTRSAEGLRRADRLGHRSACDSCIGRMGGKAASREAHRPKPVNPEDYEGGTVGPYTVERLLRALDEGPARRDALKRLSELEEERFGVALATCLAERKVWFSASGDGVLFYRL